MSTPYYQANGITLYHGDCLDLADLWKDADVLVTDPPYGISWTSGISSYKRGKRKASRTKPIAGDKNTQARDTVLELWGEKPALVFGSWRAPRPAHTKHRLIWWK